MINKLRHSFSYIFKHTLLLLVTMLFIFVSMSYFVKTEAIYHVPNDYQEMNFDGTYDWEKVPNEKTSSTDYIPYSVIHNDYVLTEEVQALLDDTNGKFVRFDTAQELYQFSIDVSFIKQATLNESTLEYQINQSLITALLSLDYVLGQDIDYSTMKSKAFIPIGYRFVGFNSQLYDNVFTGSFDGQGFEIKNLYLAGYDEFVIGTNPALTEVLDEPTTSYYAMFTINEGTVKNLGLRNPNLEILQVNEKLKYLSNLVGQNDGIVDHVYVTDTRESVTDAGIRYRVGETGKIFSAAGIIHTNNHMFTNAYYVSKVVVNGNYINKFYVEPLVYENNGFIDYLVYGESVYLDIVSVGTSTFEIETPQNGVGEFDYELMFSQYSSLNHTNSLWYFYENDGYPILQGLNYDINTEAYLIEDAVDLAFFPKLLNYQTVFYNTPFTQANYHVVNDIDMGVLVEGIYQVPNQTFNGTFYASNPNAIDNSDHYYIHHLKIDQYLLANSKIYAGLFSILGNGALVKDLNITYSSINILSGNDSYSYDNYIGGLAGQMIAASIEDIATKFYDITLKYGMKPDNFCLEIIDYYFVHKNATVIKNLEEFRKYGFRVAIDDSGDNFELIEEMDSILANIYKISRSDLLRIMDNDSSIKDFQRLVKVANDNHKTIIAEGIENSEMIKKMSEWGIRFMQGYYFSEPVELEKAKDLVEDSPWDMKSFKEFLK